MNCLWMAHRRYFYLLQKELINFRFMNYRSAHDHYRTLKNKACREAMDLFSGSIGAGLAISLLNPTVIDRAISEWPTVLNWGGILKAANNHRPRHFEVSIFYDEILCGMAFGRTSKGSSHVRIDMIEGNPHSNPLKGKVTSICLATAVFYASYIGRRRVLITRPIDSEKVMEHYSKVTDGYVMVGNMPFDYFYKNITG